jgi:tRNA-dihydrouridine synthase B
MRRSSKLGKFFSNIKNSFSDYVLHKNANKISFDKFIYMSAPLENNSDAAFRTICFNNGADVTMTEMVKMNGLSDKNENTISQIKVHDETPFIIQLLTLKEKQLETFLSTWTPPLKGFFGFNINLGCPDPEVVGLGMGAAAIKRIKKNQNLIDIFHKFGYPVSLKLRLGLNQAEKEKKLYLDLIKNTSPDFFILHARHAQQKYEEPADIGVFQEVMDVVKNQKKHIVANGDITSVSHIEMLKSIGLSGAMIGRAACYNPSIFNQLKGVKETPSIEEIRSEYQKLSEIYQTPPRYKQNVLFRFEKSISKQN